MSRQKCQQRRNEDQQPDSPERLCDRRHDSARAEPSHSQPDSEYGNQKCADAPELQHQVSNDGADQADPIARRMRARQHGSLLNDGSSGEYEASARKRRSAETHNRNPISSLSRRLLVGAKIREMAFMCALDTIRHYRRRCQTTPEPDDYAKKRGGGQLVESIELASQHSTCRGGRPGCLWSRPPPG